MNDNLLLISLLKLQRDAWFIAMVSLLLCFFLTEIYSYINQAVATASMLLFVLTQ